MFLTGATGFVGGAICEKLLAEGHEVVAGVRRPQSRAPALGVSYRELDFMTPPAPAQMVELVRGVDVVVNAVGIIRESKGLSFQRLHTDTPLALFAAAEGAGVRRLIQISAAGTSAESQFAYFRSKAAADSYLIESSDVPGIVLRPSLIYGERGEATALFRQLAALPLVPLPAGGNFSFCPILVQDLAALVAEAVVCPTPKRGAVEVGGADEMTLREILMTIRAARRGNASPGGPGLSIPKFLMKPAAWLGDLTGAGPLDSDMLDMLVQSKAPHLSDMAQSFEFRPRGLKSYLLAAAPVSSARHG